MNPPQILFIALVAISFGIALAKHGQPREGNHSVWATLVAITLELSLVYWGGFFNGEPS